MNYVILGNSLSDWLLAAGFIFLVVLIGRLAAGLLKGMAKRLGNDFLVTVVDEKICQAKTQVNPAVLRRVEQAGIRFALLPVKVEMKASPAMLQPA